MIINSGIRSLCTLSISTFHTWIIRISKIDLTRPNIPMQYAIPPQHHILPQYLISNIILFFPTIRHIRQSPIHEHILQAVQVRVKDKDQSFWGPFFEGKKLLEVRRGTGVLVEGLVQGCLVNAGFEDVVVVGCERVNFETVMRFHVATLTLHHKLMQYLVIGMRVMVINNGSIPSINPDRLHTPKHPNLQP